MNARTLLDKALDDAASYAAGAAGKEKGVLSKLRQILLTLHDRRQLSYDLYCKIQIASLIVQNLTDGSPIRRALAIATP